MKKKLLVFILVAVMALGALPAVAGASSDNAYEVGYAKVDINPYWQAWVDYSWVSSSKIPAELKNTIPTFDNFTYDAHDLMPLPMGGYGNNDKRLSRPKLMDDNGSGVGASKTNVTKAKTSATATSETTLNPSQFYSYVYANNKDYQDVHLSSNRYTKELAEKMGVTYADGIYGENDGDGVWATCVLVKDPQTNSYLLVIGLDNISVDTTLNGYIRQSIMSQTAVKKLGLTEDRILINANHTHGSVALGTQYDDDDTTTTYTLAENVFSDNITFTEQQLYWYLNFYKNYLRKQLANAAVQAINDLETAETMEKGTIDAGEQTEHHMNGVRHNVQTFTPSKSSKPAITYVRGSSFNNDMNGDGKTDPNVASSVSTTSATAGKFNDSQPVSESNDSLQILKFTFKDKDPIAMVNFRAHSTANNKEAAKALHYNISSDWVSPLRYEMEQAGYRFTLLYGNSGNLGTGVSSDTNDLIEYSQAYYSAADGHWILPATSYGRAISQAALALLGDLPEKNSSIKDPMHEVPMGALLAHKTTYLAARQVPTDLEYAAAMKYRNTQSNVDNNRTVKITIADGETVTYEGKSIAVKKGGTMVIGSKYHSSSIIARYGVTNKRSLELNTVRLGKAVAFYTTPIEASDRYFTNTIKNTSDILANASKYNDWWKLNEPDEWGTPFDLSLTNSSDGYIANELAYDYCGDYTGTDYVVAIGSYESQNSATARGEGEKIVSALNDMLRNMVPMEKYCQDCGAVKIWQPLKSSDITESEEEYILAGGHYFLAGDFSYKNQVKIKSNAKVCLNLNGFTYSGESHSAASRAFNVYGTLNVMDLSSVFPEGVLQGQGINTETSTDFAGGTLLVNTNGVVNLYSGTVTLNKQEGYGASRGGVICVNGTFCMYGGYVSGGTATNGGNIYVEAGGNLLLSGGKIENGRAEQDEVKTMGGNVYCSGTFQMDGGEICGGNAYYGGNVQVQEGTASFTMAGGKIYGGQAGYKTDVADVCTGQTGTANGLAQFRMEGGYVETAVYSQGNITLAGTTDGNTPVRVVVKVPVERLFIEGDYTGKINLVFHPDSGCSNLPEGSKVGNAVNANIHGATINLLDYTNMHLTVKDSDLVLGGRPEAYVNETAYATVSAAVDAYNAEGGWLKLNCNKVKLSGITRDLYLDLNGNQVTGISLGGNKLICKDSATDDYSSSTADSYGTLPIGISCQAADGYLATMINSRYSFHKYDLAVTEVNLRPGCAGMYYTCVFQGDEAVQAQVKRFGVAMSLETDLTRQDWIDNITNDQDGATHVWFSGDRWIAGQAETNGALVRNILKPGLSAQQNKDRGKIQLSGVCYVQLRNGNWLLGNACSFSLQDIVETVNETCDYFPVSLLNMYRTYENVMCDWKTDRIAEMAKK